jgi:hypothetical protein
MDGPATPMSPDNGASSPSLSVRETGPRNSTSLASNRLTGDDT